MSQDVGGLGELVADGVGIHAQNLLALGAAAHPANYVILRKAVLQAPFLEPIDIHRIGQVPRLLVS